jgi:hypothetical protein
VLPIVGIPLAIERFCLRFRDVFDRSEQFEHFQSFVTGLVCSENRTIAGIYQRLVFGPEYDNLHNFMLHSPWSVDSLREKRLTFVKEQLSKGAIPTNSAMSLPQIQAGINPGPERQLPAEITDSKVPCVIAIDPTFVHHTGERIHGAYWYWDYAQRAFVVAQRLVISVVATPEHLVPLGWKLYHRGFLEEQKLYLEDVKPSPDADDAEWEEYNSLVETYESNKKEHVTQPQLAEQLVDECESIGFKKDAYVCDAALVTKELMNRIEGYGQAWVSRLPKSRLVQTANGAFETVESFARSLPKDVFKPVRVKTRHGEERTYWCFSKTVMVHDWKRLRLVISYDNEKLDGEPIYLITNKKNWVQPQKIVQLYMMRDPIEHLIRDGKQELGLEDSQQRTEKGIQKHWELTFVAHTFLELGFEVPNLPGVHAVRLETIGQKSRLMEGAILQGLINLVKQWVLEGRDTKELIWQIMTKRLSRLAT